uniref:Uncharacterized protein n=1 Tax=Tanacetum cinerariifolium TaxID=118510 RepID=A0A699JKY7_TANCI|nr:hypothetical protein [Tanacetum cinerariifolium]
MERAITTDASLVAAQDSDNIAKTQSTTMSIDPISYKIGSGHTVGSGKDMMEQETDLTNFVPPTPHDSSLSGGHTPRSDEGRPNINELMNLCTPVVKKGSCPVTIQDCSRLGMKLFKIGTSKKKTLGKEYVSKHRSGESKEAKERNLSDKGSGETEVFDYTTAAEKDVNAAELVFAAGDAVNAVSVVPNVSVAGSSTSTVGHIFEDEMITMADTLMAIRGIRPRTTSVVIHDVEEEPRRETPPPTVQSQDKEQEAKDVALIKQMEDVQAMIDADALLAERLQQEESEQFTVDEQARMLVDLIAERKRFFAAHRAEQIRNKPPTKAQLRNKMVTYLKHIGKYTHNQLKSKSFEQIQMLYEREQKWINDFVPMDSEEVNDSEQQVEEDLRACLDIVPVDDIAIDVESLATKYPIVNWKTHTLTKNMMYYQIIRANGSSKNYKILTEMCDDFDRKYTMDLYRLVKERYETASLEGYDLLLWGDLITLFEPSQEDEMMSRMLNNRLEIDHESEMAFELIRFIKTQLKE